MGESEEMFEYLIGVVCPLVGDYEPGEPQWGFLFPMFTDGGGDLNHVGVYQADAEREISAYAEKMYWEYLSVQRTRENTS